MSESDFVFLENGGKVKCMRTGKLYTYKGSIKRGAQIDVLYHNIEGHLCTSSYQDFIHRFLNIDYTLTP